MRPRCRAQCNPAHSRSAHAAPHRAWLLGSNRALLCPEMTYQVELLKPLLYDPLPDDVKPRVVVRPGYWLTDEAASTYRRAGAVVCL